MKELLQQLSSEDNFAKFLGFLGGGGGGGGCGDDGDSGDDTGTGECASCQMS